MADEFNWNENVATNHAYANQYQPNNPEAGPLGYVPLPGQAVMEDGSIVDLTGGADMTSAAATDGTTAEENEVPNASPAADPKEEKKDEEHTTSIADVLKLLTGIDLGKTDGKPVANEVKTDTASIKAKATQKEGKQNALGLLRSVQIGFKGGKPTFGFSLQSAITSASKMVAGSIEKNALEQKIGTVFNAALKARGSSVALQLNAGNAAISGGVSFDSGGVFNMTVALDGSIVNNAQDILSSNASPKPEGYYTQKSNFALNVSNVVGSGAFSTQVGASSGVSFQTTLGTKYNAPIIGVSGTQGSFKKDVVPTYDTEQTFESGYLPTITGESNFYVHMEDVTISYEEEVEKLKTQERIEEEFKRLEALRAELANWYALHYPKGRDADEDDNADDEFGEGYGDHDPDEATGFGESIDPDDEGIDQ